MTATQLITAALTDLNILVPGQAPGANVLATCLTELQQMQDEWTFERLFLYLSGGAQFSQFADLTTNYVLAPGAARALRKNLAVRIAPLMKPYFKTEPLLEPLGAEAAELKASLLGVASS